MNSALALSPAPAHIVLDVALTIPHHRSIPQPLSTAFGINTRAASLRLDPGMDLIYLAEATLPNSLACLRSLAEPDVTAVALRAAYLEWQPEEGRAIGRGTSTLAALESGNCFLTANRRKIFIATFQNRHPHASHIVMDLPSHPNLLEYLRAEAFTLEISGVNRRRLTRPLAFRAVLEFDVELGY